MTKLLVLLPVSKMNQLSMSIDVNALFASSVVKVHGLVYYFYFIEDKVYLVDYTTPSTFYLASWLKTVLSIAIFYAFWHSVPAEFVTSSLAWVG